MIVRYQRMTGKNIAYPIGWDDNGLATERRVQNVFGIRPDPRKPYDPRWRPTRDTPKDAPVEEVSRRNFIEACALVTAEDERAFEAVWRRIGLSVDWSHAVRDDRRALPAHLAALVPRPGAQGRGVPEVRAHGVGRRRSHRGGAGRDRGPRGARARTTTSASASRAAASSPSRPRGPSCSARASPSSRTRRRALPGALRQARAHAALPRARADPALARTPIPRRAPAS